MADEVSSVPLSLTTRVWLAAQPDQPRQLLSEPYARLRRVRYQRQAFAPPYFVSRVSSRYNAPRNMLVASATTPAVAA